MNLLIGIAIGFIFAWPAVLLLNFFGKRLQLWQTLSERTVLVYTLFGKVIGHVEEAGLFFPIAHFGPKAVLLPIFGKTYKVSTALKQSYLRNQLVNSEEGAPMGVGIWYEMFVNNPAAYLFQNSDPAGSLRANVATAVSKQLSNLKLETLLEDRDTLSMRVRGEVSPASTKWGYQLGSTY